MISQGLEGFLNWLRETEQQLHMAEQWEQEANDATQDILHRLELGELAAEDAGRLALKLLEVRQKRREAKDLLDQAGPVADWLESRRAVVKELEQLRASPHGKIKDSTLQSICNRANEIACRPPEGEEEA